VDFDVVGRALELLSHDPEVGVRDGVLIAGSLQRMCQFALTDVLAHVVLQWIPSLRSASWVTRVRLREASVSCVHSLASFTIVYMLSAISFSNEGPCGFLGFGALTHIPIKLIEWAGATFLGFLLWHTAYAAAYRTNSSWPCIQIPWLAAAGTWCCTGAPTPR
jgi:hypothetical protein